MNRVLEFHTGFNSFDVTQSFRMTQEEYLKGLDAAIANSYKYS
jgi:hypothetical protein